MAIEELVTGDIWVKIPENSIRRNIRLVYDYVCDHDMMVNPADVYERYVKTSTKLNFCYQGEIYQFDIATRISKLKPEERSSAFGSATFILDEEKIVLRPFFPEEHEYLIQRDIILSDFLNYVRGKDMKVEWGLTE